MNSSLPNDAQVLKPQVWHQLRAKLLSLSQKQLVDEDGFSTIVNVAEYNELLESCKTEESAQQFELLGLHPIDRSQLISVVVPVFNEDSTIDWVLRRLASCPVVGQIIVVNDASSDGTAGVLSKISQESSDPFWVRRLPEGIKLISHQNNKGKGAALRTGFPHAQLRWVAIQDADTEYDPMDLLRLLSATTREQVTVVYGSRYLCRTNQSSPLWHRFGNGVITWFSNLFTGLSLTDVETCYKMIRTDILQSIEPNLKEDRFGIEIELTAKLARHPAAKFAELPISYEKRSYAEGKKIGVKDGLRALWCMLRYRLAD